MTIIKNIHNHNNFIHIIYTIIRANIRLNPTPIRNIINNIHGIIILIIIPSKTSPKGENFD
tara:strand:- start:5932 stop:6114 length:183 start_codon:yes stop_codon:yes gene_type:complete